MRRSAFKAVPLPVAYTCHVSHTKAIQGHHDSGVYDEVKIDNVQTVTEADGLKGNDDEGKEEAGSAGKAKKSVLIFLRNSRIYI